LIFFIVAETMRSINGSLNQGSDVGDKKFNCPRCRSACEIEYNVGISQKNFLKPTLLVLIVVDFCYRMRKMK